MKYIFNTKKAIKNGAWECWAKECDGLEVKNGQIGNTGFVCFDSALDDWCDKIDDFDMKVVILTNGKTVTARMFKGNEIEKEAQANCSPSDTFDFGIGAKLAIERLFEKKHEWKEVHRRAKIGEYVRINQNCGGYTFAFDPCGIYKVERIGDPLIGGSLPHLRSKDGRLLSFTDDEYVVLEGYSPDEQKEPVK